MSSGLITGPEVSVRLSRIERAFPEEQDPLAHSERGHSSTSVFSAGEHTAGSETLTRSGRSSKLSWRERDYSWRLVPLLNLFCPVGDPVLPVSR